MAMLLTLLSCGVGADRDDIAAADAVDPVCAPEAGSETDADCVVTREWTWDDDADGGFDVLERELWAYDLDGNLLMYEYDDRGDCSVEARYAYTWDADGNLLNSRSLGPP